MQEKESIMVVWCKLKVPSLRITVRHHSASLAMLISYRRDRIFNPKLSRCRSQHVSVESSSLLHHSIYLWFICFTWWSIDELENLHADRTTVCFEPWQKLRVRLGARKTGLSPPVFLYWPFQGGTSVVVPYCSCCLCLYFGSSIMLVTYFVNFR